MSKRLFYNGNIVTMAYGSAHEEPMPEALLTEDGTIRFIGALEDAKKLAGDCAKMTDLDGRTLLPAFIDGHSHISMTAQMSEACDLTECYSFSDVVQNMRSFIQERNITPDGLAAGFGYDHNFLKEGTHPTKDVLDQISDTVPIYISHVSGHMGCANSAALALAGIDENTPDPEGGVIGRIAGTSEPNGYLEEAAMTILQKIMPGRVHADMASGLQRAQELYLSCGIVTVQDGASGRDTVRLLYESCKNDILDVDVVAYPIFGEEDPEETLQMFPDALEKYDGNFKLGGYKAVLDGSPQGKSAWLTEPYEGSDGYCGYPWAEDETVLTYMKEAVANRRQILVHCNGDAAADQYLDAYEKALSLCPEVKSTDLRPVMIHCQTVREDQLDRMKVLNMIPSIFVGHVFFWGDVHLRNLGPQRASRISPCRWALEKGLVMNFHQDTPVTKPDMLRSVWAAVNRITREGRVLGPKQRIDVYSGLKAVTINAAYAYHEENMKGTLEVGKRGDFVILDRNPLAVPTEEIKDISVSETIRAGKTLYRA